MMFTIRGCFLTFSLFRSNVVFVHSFFFLLLARLAPLRFCLAGNIRDSIEIPSSGSGRCQRLCLWTEFSSEFLSLFDRDFLSLNVRGSLMIAALDVFFSIQSFIIQTSNRFSNLDFLIGFLHEKNVKSAWKRF